MISGMESTQDVSCCTQPGVHVTIYGIRRAADRCNIPDPLNLLDVSSTGIVAHADQPYEAGQEMLLCMPLSFASGKRCINATVVECNQDDTGWRVGMLFSGNHKASA